MMRWRGGVVRWKETQETQKWKEERKDSGYPPQREKRLDERWMAERTLSLLEMIDENATFGAEFAFGNVGTRSAADVARSFFFVLFVREKSSDGLRSLFEYCGIVL